MKEIKWVNLLLELFVVIIGVTIAFSLDSWKEDKRTRKAEIEYLMSFKNDLEKDVLGLDSLIDTLSIQRNNNNQLLRCIYSNDFSNQNLLNYSLSLFFISNFTPHAATYKSMTSSGQLQLIQDFKLRKELVDQYDITYTFLELLDNLNQSQVYEYRMPFLHDNIQYTAGGIRNTDFMQTSKYNNMAQSAYFFLNRKIDEYSKAKENAVKLINSIDQVLNEK